MHFVKFIYIYIYIYCIYIYMFTNSHECGLYVYIIIIIISSMTAPGLVGWSKKVHISFKKKPPAEFSGYGPVH